VETQPPLFVSSGGAMTRDKRKDAAKPDVENRFPSGVPLRGWPGYRTRDNRSGLDPIDTRAEAAHLGGTFLHDVLTLGLRTRNPFHLTMLFLFGVIPFVFLAFLVFGTLSSGIPSNWSALILPVFLLIATVALTINFALSILHIIGIIHRPK
jgi:hypothetical protein